jgi:hypothetical protein
MKTTPKTVLFTFLLSALAAPLWPQGTYTAASCNYSDVKAVINGSTHNAVNEDVIIIPAGTCTWTSELAITVGITVTGSGTPNTGGLTFGAGTPTTIIVDNAGSSNPLFGVTLSYGQTFTLSLLDIEPESASTTLASPIQVAGTCTSNGCPNLRVDNIIFGETTPWTESGNGNPAGWLILTDNVFGVLDHNTMPNGSGTDFSDPNHSAYLGVGGYGDNSWAAPDSTGGANNLYEENNVLYTTTAITDCEEAPVGGAVGGCRYVARFNHVVSNGGFGVFGNHGLDTDGRPQGGRQIEAYGNTFNCVSSSCNVPVGFRSGTGFIFGNTVTQSAGAWFNAFVGVVVYRNVFTGSSGWGACGGSSPYDTNGGVTYYSGTTTSGSSGMVLYDSTKSWTTNQFIPTGAPYSVYDVTKGFWAEVASNTATTITIQPSLPEQTNAFGVGDSYQILRATVCADQTTRGRGAYVSGSTPTPAAPLSQALDPIYEWDDTASLLGEGVNVYPNGTLRLVANRDWYTDGSGGTPHAQTSSTSPFNGSSGVGFGTLANRPTSCTPYVGYFATDQGSWNGSGNGFGQGELFVCTATNTWTLYYTPYPYPHPLTQGTGTGTAVSLVSCNPTNLNVGGTSACVATLSQAAGTGGITVTLSSSMTALTVPASVSVASGATSANFTATAVTNITPQAAVVTASYNGSSATASISSAPGPPPSVGIAVN